MHKREVLFMWWLSLIVVFIFIGLNVAIFLLRNKPQLSYAIAYSISSFILVYKIIEYICHQAMGNHMNFPVEFSALSYLILGITVTFRIKKLEPLACFISILAGFVYSVVCWFFPTSVITEAQTEPLYFLVMAIIMHHLLYFTGMLLLVNSRRFSFKRCWVIFLGMGLMIGYSWIIYLFTGYADVYGKPLIIQTCDGSILQWLGMSQIQGWQMAIFSIIEIIILCGLMAGFYSINNITANRRKKKGLPDDYYPEKWKYTYKFNG